MMLPIVSFSRYFFMLLLLTFSVLADSSTADEIVWYEKGADGQPLIHLYFFWSKKCPHCLAAQPDMLELEQTLPWLRLHSFELIDHPQHVDTFISMTASFGNDARSVPSFMFCGNIVSGYDNKSSSGQWLNKFLQACYQFARYNNPDNNTSFVWQQNNVETLKVPLLGTISSDEYSLPVLTLLIAGMDAFNPCAFFVLLFLLSMMVHSRSRLRIALIGGIFVFFSGLIYFLFMSAWLNLFLYLGELRIFTYIAGVVALLIAAINIKDFFYFKKGFSLSISATDKPRLLDRIRLMLRLDSLFTVIIASIVLAVVANSYELLCTAGFPMVYTRILTLNALSTQSYYLYLLLYNLTYIIPLLAIVILFTIRLGSRKLSEREGQMLKLISGNMMLMLGLLLLFAPQLLNNLLFALLLILTALALSWGMMRLGNTPVSPQNPPKKEK